MFEFMFELATANSSRSNAYRNAVVATRSVESSVSRLDVHRSERRRRAGDAPRATDRFGSTRRSANHGSANNGPGTTSPLPPRRTWLTFLIILLINYAVARLLFANPDAALKIPYTAF